MDRDFDGFGIDLGVPEQAFRLPAKRRNPGSVAEMLSILRDEMATFDPKTDEVIDAMSVDDDVEWDDRDDPNYFAWLED